MSTSNDYPSVEVAAPPPDRPPLYRPFPIHCLPEPMHPFVAAGAAALGVDPAFVALPALASVTAVVGYSAHAVVKGTPGTPGAWTEPGLLWLCLIAESGTGKTPAMKLATAALREIHAVEQRALGLAEQVYAADKLRHARELAAWQRAGGKEDDDANPPPPPPEPPSERHLIVGDATLEALVPILMDSPRGPLLCRDEIAGWIENMDRYTKGGGDMAQYLAMHTGEMLQLNRKTPDALGRRRFCVPSASLSILGGIQPARFTDVFTPRIRGAGLLGRMLVVMPPRRPKAFDEATIPPDVDARWSSVIRSQYAEQPLIDAAGQVQPRFVHMLPAAKVLWTAWQREHNNESQELHGDELAAFCKLEAHVPRFALLFATLRWATAGKAGTPVITSDDVQRACVLTEFFKYEARRLYATLAEDHRDRTLRQFAEIIQARFGGSVSVRDWQRRRGSGRVTSDQAKAELEALERTNYGRIMYLPTGENGGRQPHVFTLRQPDDPVLTGDTTPFPDAPAEVVSTVNTSPAPPPEHREAFL